MSLHVLRGYHFTKENILSLLSSINIKPENPNTQTKSNFIFVYDHHNIISEYAYYYNQYSSYPTIHVLDDKHNVQNILKEDSYNGYNCLESLADDLLSNNIYKIEQISSVNSHNNPINSIHLYIE